MESLQEASDVGQQKTSQSSLPENEAHSRVGLKAMEGGPQKEAPWRTGGHEEVVGHCERPAGMMAVWPTQHMIRPTSWRNTTGKMSVPDPERTPATMPHTIKDILLEVKTSESEVRK
ncbi:hypothetical protein E2C01_040294 [Portunus trituberculatus]|uniref:Uncharacterized protein n=1 Tax=Portunus trituberculatus TaxID=210409 RepID=A0A5B7FND8_PORTR|nr:hypothetical protein [Portunus trituberculatus]